jgi:type IV secretory pathway VirB9-like protein
MIFFVLSLVAAAADVSQARTVKYGPADIVPIRAKVHYSTLVVLPSSEQILDYVTGDKDLWVIQGVANYAYIKPGKEGTSTNLNLITASGHIYSLLLNEVSGKGEPDIKVFIEPTDNALIQSVQGGKFVPAGEAEAARRALQQATTELQKSEDTFRTTYPTTLHFGYSFDPGREDCRITALYDDGRFTYLHTNCREQPALYEVRDGQPTLVNFDLRDGVYIVRHVVERGYLAIGKTRLNFQRKGK